MWKTRLRLISLILLPVISLAIYLHYPFTPSFDDLESVSLFNVQKGMGKGSRVLVTGAAGFIGSHVAKYCLEHLGMVVVAVDDLSGGFMENISPGIIFIKGDLKDDTFVRILFQLHGPFDYIYHLAAYAAEGMSHFIRKFNYRNNLVASTSLLNQAIVHNVKTMVFTSSIAVYGAGKPPMTEDTVPIPEDPYGISKYAMELDIKAAHEMFGLNYVIFRPHNVYGPHQNIFDKYRNVIGIFMTQILHHQPLTIFGDGLQTRAFSYIDDVAPAIAMAPLNPSAINQVFNVGGDQPYTLLELAEEVSNIMNVEKNLLHLPARKEVVHASADHSKLRRYFNLPPATTLHDGLVKMHQWVQTQGKKLSPIEFESVEVLKNMPPSWITEKMKQNAENNIDVVIRPT